uniref:VWFD domain-containing protein n=1 Tax=Lotharella globosa TaxID=91324 RepID=A0A7S3Z338_9EUKA
MASLAFVLSAAALAFAKQAHPHRYFEEVRPYRYDFNSTTCGSKTFSCVPPCSDPQNVWVGGYSTNFAGDSLQDHYNADILILNRTICRYRIHWFSGSKSGWYYPGVNDIFDSKKNERIWNPDSVAKGRRAWTMFADHTHDIVWCDDECEEHPVATPCRHGDEVTSIDGSLNGVIVAASYAETCPFSVRVTTSNEIRSLNSWQLRLKGSMATCENPCRLSTRTKHAPPATTSPNVESELLPEVYRGSLKWAACDTVGTKMFCAPHNADRILVVDRNTGTSSLLGPRFSTRAQKYNKCYTMGDSLYCPPFTADHTLKINATDLTVTFLTGASTWYSQKYALCGSVGLVLYCPPFATVRVLKIDTRTDEVSFIGPVIRGGGYRYSSEACKSVRDRVYCAPLDHPDILKIDGSSDAVSFLRDKPYAAGSLKYGPCKLVGTNIYCVPYKAAKVLKIDTTTDKATTLEGPKFITESHNICKHVGSTIFCAPYGADKVLRIDTEQDRVSYEGPSYFPGLARKWINCVDFFGRYIVCVPCRATRLLLIDGQTGNSSLVGPDYSTLPASPLGHTTLNRFAVCEKLLQTRGTTESAFCVPSDAHNPLRIDVDVSSSAKENQ